MLEEFIVQNYFIIKSNVVVNCVVWDGDTTQWEPPQGSIAIISATTPAMIWEAVTTDKKITDYVLTEIIGAGDIGFKWDGAVLTTNQQKPNIPVYEAQPLSNGTVSA